MGQKPVNRAFSDFVFFGDFRDGCAVCQFRADLGFLAVQNVTAVDAAERSAQFFAVHFAALQGFFGAFADHFPFQLGDQPESERQYLALHVVAQFVTVFDGQNFRADFHTMF